MGTCPLGHPPVSPWVFILTSKAKGCLIGRHLMIGPIPAMTLQPGALVQLADRPGRTYQVVNLDEFSDCVWVRSWPLSSLRQPTFSVSTTQVLPPLPAAA